MKVAVIGDIHGINTWKDNIEIKNYDKIIFLGDYVDSFNVSDKDIIYNLNNIIQFKKDNMAKVELLLGNHDIQYLLYRDNKFALTVCSGFRHKIAYQLCNIFNENKNLFKASYQINNYLFSHAGLTNESYKNYIKNHIELLDGNLSDRINILFDGLHWSLFCIGYKRGGNRPYGSIFWADASELSDDMLNNYHQVVGHTELSNIYYKKIDDNTSTAFIDNEKREIYEIIINTEDYY